MGGSGASLKNGGKLTAYELRRRHALADSDAYMFDVEYQKLKQEQERLARQYERARERYLRISEQLREEMLNGESTGAIASQYMSALTAKGVELQQEQAKMQKQLDTISDSRLNVATQMDDLRKKAFSGSTTAYNYSAVDREKEYKGFKLKGKIDYSKVKVVEMSPAEYLRRVAFEVKGRGFDELMTTTATSDVERLARNMLRGTQYTAPTLDYKNGTTKGDDKALAALLNGYKRIPVMIVG